MFFSKTLYFFSPNEFSISNLKDTVKVNVFGFPFLSFEEIFLIISDAIFPEIVFIEFIEFFLIKSSVSLILYIKLLISFEGQT